MGVFGDEESFEDNFKIVRSPENTVSGAHVTVPTLAAVVTIPKLTAVVTVPTLAAFATVPTLTAVVTVPTLAAVVESWQVLVHFINFW